MKKALGFLAFLLLAASLSLAAEVVDRIVAVVGPEIITQRELDRAYNEDSLRLMMPDPLSGVSATPLSREQYLEAMIEKLVISQEVKRLGIRVDALEVERMIDRKRESLGLTEDQFAKALAEQGVSMDLYRLQVKDQLITYRLIAQEVQGEIEVTEEEVKAYYRQHPDLFLEADSYHLKHIFIPLPAEGDSVAMAAARKTLEAVRVQLVQGADFAEMAKTFSRSPTALSGGDLGWFAWNEMDAPFQEQVKILAPGQLSPVFVDKGLHLVLLVEVKRGSPQPLEKVHDSIRDYLYQLKAMERYDLWLDRLKARTFIDNRLAANPTPEPPAPAPPPVLPAPTDQPAPGGPP